jgi:hypothetical protein
MIQIVIRDSIQMDTHLSTYLLNHSKETEYSHQTINKMKRAHNSKKYMIIV